MYETNMNTKMTFQNMTYALKIIDFFKSFVLWIKIWTMDKNFLKKPFWQEEQSKIKNNKSVAQKDLF